MAQPDPLLAQIKSLTIAGKYQDAIALCNSGLVAAPDDADLFHARGHAQLYGQMTSSDPSVPKYQDALNDMNRAIALSPGNAEFYSDRGVVYHRLNQDTNAIADWQKAINIDPNYCGSYVNFADYYIDISDYINVIKYCNLALAAQSGIAEAYNNRAWARFKLQQLPEAIADAEQAVTLALAANDTYVLENSYETRGEIHLALNQIPQATADLKAALAINPNDRFASAALAKAQAAAAQG